MPEASASLLQNPRGCGRVGSVLDAAPEGSMVMVPGFGEVASWPVDTANPEAQAWFDHGVRLRWAFEHKESVRAFRRARAHRSRLRHVRLGRGLGDRAQPQRRRQ